jgi:tetratricopeptide (TPR) repeat protein
VYFNRGLSKYQLHEFQRAIADFDTALLLNPKNPAVYKARALAKLEEKQPRPAWDDLERAATLTPNDPILCNAQGKAYYDLREYAKAILYYDKAKRIGGLDFKPPYEYRQEADAKIPKNPNPSIGIPTAPAPLRVPLPPMKPRLPRNK